MHEHVFVIEPEFLLNYPEEWGDEELRVSDAVKQLEELKCSGVDTIVDLTVIGIGRFIPRIQRVAERTRLNIVVAAGLYSSNEIQPYFRFRTAQDGGADPIADMFIRDITLGIGNTGVRAGILKCATDKAGITPGVDRILRGTARAHRTTGVPISTHTDARSRGGLDQQRIFREEGVDLSRVIIGHCGDTADLSYIEKIIASGSYVGMDRFGLDWILPFEDRVKTVATLCEHGHASRILLSHDAACFFQWIPEEKRKNSMPNWHYRHIQQDVIPALKKSGVSDEQLKTMLVENPRRIFERQEIY
jgi:phosphotriesterase-related protein